MTICTHKGTYLFGEVVDGDMMLNDCGAVVQSCWNAIPAQHPIVELDAFVIMPDHAHGVIVIVEHDDTVGATRRVAPTTRPAGPKSGSLGAIIGQFKSIVTKRIRQRLHVNIDIPVWHRNYYEHVTRSEKSLQQIRLYITNNPARWADDALHPEKEPSRLREITSEMW